LRQKASTKSRKSSERTKSTYQSLPPNSLRTLHSPAAAICTFISGRTPQSFFAIKGILDFLPKAVGWTSNMAFAYRNSC